MTFFYSGQYELLLQWSDRSTVQTLLCTCSVNISTFITVGSILYVLLHGEHSIKYILIMPRFVKTFTFLMSQKYGKLYARLIQVNDVDIYNFIHLLLINEWQKYSPAGQLICICFHSTCVSYDF